MESDYAKEVSKQDVWNPEYRTEEIMKYFCSKYFYQKCLKEILMLQPLIENQQ